MSTIEPIDIPRPTCCNCNQVITPYYRNNELIMDGNCETCNNKVIVRIIEVKKDNVYLSYPAIYDCTVEYENGEVGKSTLDIKTIYNLTTICPNCKRKGRSRTRCDNGCSTNYCPCGTTFHHNEDNQIGHDPTCGT